MKISLTASDISSVLVGECTIKCQSVDVSFGGAVSNRLNCSYLCDTHKSEHRHINKWLNSHKDQASVMPLDIAGISTSKISEGSQLFRDEAQLGIGLLAEGLKMTLIFCSKCW